MRLRQLRLVAWIRETMKGMKIRGRPSKSDRPEADRLQFVVDQLLDGLHEADRVRETCVILESRLVNPSRQNEERPRVPRRAISPVRQAARVGAGEADLVAEDRHDRVLLPLPGMETSDD